MSRSETPAPENPTDGPRFALLTDATMTPRQRESYQAIVSGPRKGARGPFNALLRSPEVADRVQKIGEYIRFWAHSQLARTAGLPDAIIDAIAEGRRPSPMSDDQRIVYDFCTELFRDKAVSDATFKAAVDRFGEQGVIDLIAASGYYSIVSMVLNVDRHPLPAGERPPLKPI